LWRRSRELEEARIFLSLPVTRSVVGFLEHAVGHPLLVLARVEAGGAAIAGHRRQGGPHMPTPADWAARCSPSNTAWYWAAPAAGAQPARIAASV